MKMRPLTPKYSEIFLNPNSRKQSTKGTKKRLG